MMEQLAQVKRNGCLRPQFVRVHRSHQRRRCRLLLGKRCCPSGLATLNAADYVHLDWKEIHATGLGIDRRTNGA